MKKKQSSSHAFFVWVVWSVIQSLSLTHSLIIFRIRNVSVPKEMHEFVMNSMKLDERNIVPGAKGDLFSLSLLHFHRYYEYSYNFKLLKSLTRSLFFVREGNFLFKKNLRTIQMCFIQGSFRVWVRAMQPNITCKLVSIIGLILKHVHCYRPWTKEWFFCFLL